MLFISRIQSLLVRDVYRSNSTKVAQKMVMLGNLQNVTQRPLIIRIHIITRYEF